MGPLSLGSADSAVERLGDFMVIIIGESALAYWRTPPCVRDAETSLTNLPDHYQPDAEIARRLFRERLDEGTAIRKIRGRVLSDLKGIPLPIRVITDEMRHVGDGPIVSIRRGNVSAIRPFCVDLGNDLFVASPELAIAQAGRGRTDAALLHLMYEACGIYALFYPTVRAQLVLSSLPQEHLSGNPITAYSDEFGIPLTFDETCSRRWSYCEGKDPRKGTLWKRPPLATREQLKNAYREIKEVNGIVRARGLAPLVLDGSGSPLETTMCLLEFLPTYRGGEQWEIPHLNRTVLLNENARNIQDGDHLVADQEWHSRLAILEVNGMGHHADPTGFARTSRRRVSLEAMGYVVREINYEQIEDLDKLNIILESYAEPLGLKHCPRTASFIDARERLHRDLFSIPGIHGKALIDNPGW